MKSLCILLFVGLCMAFLAEQRVAGWPRVRVRGRIRIGFSKRQMSKLCEGVEKAMIKREDWQAMEPRHVLRVNGMADNIIIWQTGPDTCKNVGLFGYNCQRCMQDEGCVKELLAAFQTGDLDDGKDDIRYNFLIGQDGVIYEGRGWGVVGQHTNGKNFMSVGIGMIGDYTKLGPSQAVQNALKNLISCGQAAKALSGDAAFITSPEMTGKAFFEMIERCDGLCTDPK